MCFIVYCTYKYIHMYYCKKNIVTKYKYISCYNSIES